MAALVALIDLYPADPSLWHILNGTYLAELFEATPLCKKERQWRHRCRMGCTSRETAVPEKAAKDWSRRSLSGADSWISWYATHIAFTASAQHIQHPVQDETVGNP